MKEQITLTRHEAEEIAGDLDGWAQVLESDPGGEHPWIEEMVRHARLLRDKMLVRVE
jgi:hypothetical protein